MKLRKPKPTKSKVKGKGGKMNIVATDVNNSSSDEFTTELGETSLTFNMVFKIENLKLFSGDYNVEITCYCSPEFRL